MEMTREVIDDIVEWDVKNWWRAIRFWEEASPMGDLSGMQVLDIGGRNGGLSLYWALKGANVICSDINERFFSKALELHKKYGVDKRIRYEVIDATCIPYVDCFDIVCFKSVLGGVGNDDRYDRQEVMMKNIYDALKGGGVLYFAENMKASLLHQVLRRLFAHRDVKWRYVSLSEICELTDVFSEIERCSLGFLGVLGRQKWSSGILSELDNRFDRYIKEQDRYIVSCVCRKDVNA